VQGSPNLAHVRVAATPIGPSLPGLQAYHTSVLINDKEYAFGGRGILRSAGPQSHLLESDGLCRTALLDFGMTDVSLTDFERQMAPIFRKGTYDVLRKNCNSFTSCAVFLLTGQQLDTSYSYVESLGCWLDSLGLVRVLSGGKYVPNERAEDFDKDRVVRQLRRPSSLGATSSDGTPTRGCWG